MSPPRPELLAALLLALTPAWALASETCEEVQETCLENCHVDFGMEAKRVELTKCVERCGRRMESCADLRQEQKRSQFRLHDPGATPRRGDPVDVYHYEENKKINVKAAPYEQFDEGDRKPRADEPKPRPKKDDESATTKADSEEGPKQSRAEMARKNDPDAEPPPPQKKKSEDLSGDDWAKE